MTDNQDQPLSRRAIREREAAEAARAAGGVPTPAPEQPASQQPAPQQEGASQAPVAQPSQAPVAQPWQPSGTAAPFTDTSAPVTSGLTRRELRAIREAQEQAAASAAPQWAATPSSAPIAPEAPAPAMASAAPSAPSVAPQSAVPSPPPSFDALLAGDALTNSDAAPASPLGGSTPSATPDAPSTPPPLIEPEEPRDAASNLEALLGGGAVSLTAPPAALPPQAPPAPAAWSPEPAPQTPSAPAAWAPEAAAPSQPPAPSWIQPEPAPDPDAPVLAATASAAPVPAESAPVEQSPVEQPSPFEQSSVEQSAPVEQIAPAPVSQPPYPPFPSPAATPFASFAPAVSMPEQAEVPVTEPAEPVESTTGERPRNHWSRQAELDDEAQPATGGLSRHVGGTATGNALVLPEVPNTDLIGTTIGNTGDVVVTGSISLPASLSSTGALPAQLDESDLDSLLDPGDQQVVSTQSQPVRAVRAVSTQTASRDLIGSVKPPKRGNRSLTALIIAAGAMAVVVVTLLVVALTSGVLG